MKQYVKKSVQRKFQTTKTPYGKISVQRKILTAKVPYGEKSVWRKILTVKNPMVKIPTAKNPTAKIPATNENMQTLHNTLYELSKILTKKLPAIAVFGNISSTPCRRKNIFNNSKHFLNKIQIKLSTNLGISPILTTLWTNSFKFFLSDIKLKLLFYSIV